jgi:hypothetical protein
MVINLPEKNNILFWIAILGFFGINGIDLLNALSELVLKLGNGLFILLFFIWIYMEENKK